MPHPQAPGFKGLDWDILKAVKVKGALLRFDWVVGKKL